MIYQNNFAIANRTSIMYKYVFPNNLITDISFSKTYGDDVTYTYLGSEITQIGIYYYTTNSSQKTRIPAVNTTYYNGTISSKYKVEEESKANNITNKVRIIKDCPILFLLEGLTPNTTYHIGGYYIRNNNPLYFNEVTIKTRNASTNKLVFNEIQISSEAQRDYPENVEKIKSKLEEIFPKVSEMYEDATNVDNQSEPYDPLIRKMSQNAAADSGMHFNAMFSFDSDNLRSVVIHEVQHGYFNSKIDSGFYSSYPLVIKFMEFATNSEKATWGQLTNHFYPIISSARFDYIDDYLVVMATNVNDLTFND